MGRTIFIQVKSSDYGEFILPSPTFTDATDRQYDVLAIISYILPLQGRIQDFTKGGGYEMQSDLLFYFL